MLDTIIEWDYHVQMLLNQQWTNDFLDMIMPYWRDKKTWIPLYLLLIIGLIAKYRWKGVVIILTVLLVIAVSDIVSSHLIKKTVERLRPCRTPVIMEQVRMLVNCGGGYSFTSSHATNHFALATILFLVFKQHHYYRWVWRVLFLWAASIAYGQVYVGVHFPVDILCGAVLGMLIAFVVCRIIYRQLPKKWLIL